MGGLSISYCNQHHQEDRVLPHLLHHKAPQSGLWSIHTHAVLAHGNEKRPANRFAGRSDQRAADVGLLLQTTVTVFKAHDVVFAQVRAGLHFDQLQRHLARVGQRVLDAQRDVSGLIL